MTTLGRLLKVAFLERKWMTLGIVAGVATVAAAIGLMMTSGRLISMAALQPHIGMIGVAVVGVRFFGLSRGVFRYVERLISHQVTFRLLMRFRIWFFSALAPVAPKGLERYRSNELLGRLVSDVENLEHVFLKIIAPPLISILVAIPTVFIFSWLHWHLGVWMAGALIVAHLLPWFALGEGMKLSGQISDEQIRLKENWLDGFQGLSDLVAFDASHRFFGSLAQRTDDYLQTRARFLRHHEKQNLLMTTLLYATVLGVLYLGADLVLQQQLDGVNLALVVLGAMASFEATMTLPSALANMAGSLHSAKRVHEVMDAAVKDAVQIDYVPSASPVTHKGFDLKNINFDYTTDIPVFSGLSLSLEPGRVYAITGASGCGKSTLLSLLSGTRSPNKGQLTFLGQPLCNVREERLRRELSVVPQYRHVFSDTLRANLRIASPNASDVELKDALAPDCLLLLLRCLRDSTRGLGIRDSVSAVGRRNGSLWPERCCKEARG